MRKRYFILLSVLAAVLVLSACSDHEGRGETAAKEKRIEGVKTAPVRVEKINILYAAPGTIRAAVQSTLTAKVMGNVTRILVAEGDRVKKGEPLLRIESKEISAGIAQAGGGLAAAKAALKNAEVNYKRISVLFSRGSATRFELDDAIMRRDGAKGQVEQAAGAVRQARAMKGYAVIRAPADGRITRRHVDVGDQAAPGRPLLDFSGAAPLQFQTYVPESRLASIKIAEEVRVTVSALGDRRIEGTIAEMEPASDPVTHSAKIKIDLKGAAGALPGMYGKAFFPTGMREAVLLPKDALFTRGQLTAVYVLNEKGILHFRLVRTGREYDGRVEILSGLSGGERVAVSGIDRIEDGMEVGR